MNIIITSDHSGIGKTTLCRNLAKRLTEYSLGGILCTGDKVQNFYGREMQFYAQEFNDDVIKVGKCLIYKDAIEFAKNEIINSKDKDIIFIDEYGPLEFRGEGLKDAMEDVLPLEKSIIIVRGIVLPRFLEKYGNNFKIYDVTEKNRDSLDNLIFQQDFRR